MSSKSAVATISITAMAPSPYETSRREPAPQSSRPDEILSLTSIRGLAAVWVVLFHFQYDLYVLLPSSTVLSPVLSRGSLAVPTFFVLSGYVLSLNYYDSFSDLSFQEYRRFLGKRWLRIYPLHFVTLMAVVGMMLVARRIGANLAEEGYSAAAFVQNLFLVQAWVPDFQLNWNYPSWSISSEWLAYLLFPGLCVLLHRLKSVSGIRIVAISAWLGMLVYYSFSLSERLAFGEMLAVLCPFLLGASGFVLQRDNHVSHGVLLWICRSSFAAVLVIPYVTRRHVTLVLLLSALSGIVLTLGFLGNRSPSWLKARSLIALGNASYALYLTHALAQKLLYALLPADRFVSSGLLIRWLVVIGYAVVIGGGTWLGYALIEIRFRRRLGRWIRRRQSPTTSR